MSEHDGHRERLKSRFLEHGLDSFSDQQILELLLFFAIPRRDTEPLAKALLRDFGCLDAVMEARPEELKKVPGMGNNAACLIQLIPAVNRRYLTRKAEYLSILDTTKKRGAYLAPQFLNERDEVALLLCLDARQKALCCREVGRGETNLTSISIRKIVEIALSVNASYAILSHNHTSSIALPSSEDYSATKKVLHALATVGVELLDHIIIAADDFVSIAETVGPQFFDPNTLS